MRRRTSSRPHGHTCLASSSPPPCPMPVQGERHDAKDRQFHLYDFLPSRPRDFLYIVSLKARLRGLISLPVSSWAWLRFPFRFSSARLHASYPLGGHAYGSRVVCPAGRLALSGQATPRVDAGRVCRLPWPLTQLGEKVARPPQSPRPGRPRRLACALTGPAHAPADHAASGRRTHPEPSG